ncbi:hypothetical protein NDU88_001785 [Pleurodeles waltl]|uniref:Uncharacterized protein n=1 Tax=Pleurodeles waltl TaxID=8319 RepID=A0AAV7UAG3_PLEWA|nr:hypothetical protein NDU88_001785 [Pleurodeles waltl]
MGQVSGPSKVCTSDHVTCNDEGTTSRASRCRVYKMFPDSNHEEEVDNLILSRLLQLFSVCAKAAVTKRQLSNRTQSRLFDCIRNCDNVQLEMAS